MALDLSSWVKNNVPPDPDDELSAAPTILLARRRKGAESASAFWLRTAHNYIIRCSPSVANEDGHRAAFRVACILVIGYNFSVSDAFPLFQVWNRACKPPWSSYDLQYKLEQAEEQRASHPNPGYLRQNLRLKRKQGAK